MFLFFTFLFLKKICTIEREELLLTPNSGVRVLFEALSNPEGIQEGGLPLFFIRTVTKPSTAGLPLATVEDSRGLFSQEFLLAEIKC
jgi:hypothetical protein